MLVVEDDRDAREILRIALRSQGASVREAEDVMSSAHAEGPSDLMTPTSTRKA